MEFLEKYFDTAFAAPNGVKRLRQLIWNLALKGKLVPQNPDDPPALELLKEAKVERQKLIENKKIRKPKLSSKVTQLDLPYQLPRGWEWVRFGDISINRDAERIPISKEQRKGTQGIYDYYGASGVIDKINDYLFKKDLLLIGEDGANLINRSTPIAFIARGKYWVNNHAHVIDAHDSDLLLYLEKYINAIDLKPYVTGTAQPKMNQVKMNSILVALPPLPEQRRIVAKIDQLMARCDELEKLRAERDRKQITVHTAALNRLLTAPDTATFIQSWQFITKHFSELYSVKENVTELRKAVLQLAVMGKLVPQDSRDSSAQELLKEIGQNKQALLKEKKIKKPKALSRIDKKDIPYEIPNSWAWVRLGQVGAFERGRSKHRPRNDTRLFSNGHFPFVQTGDVSKAKFTNSRITTCKSYYNEFGLQQSRLWPGGTLCITIAANIAETGYLDMEACIPDSVVAFLSLDDAVSKFVKVFIDVAKDDLENYAPSTAQKNINLGIINQLVFPLPPLKEQRRIVAKVDQLMSLCDELEQKIDQATHKQIALLNAVIANI